MALKHLELEEMIGLTAPLVRDKGALLRAVPEAAGLLPLLESAHDDALAARAGASAAAADADTSEISRELAEVDVLHDDSVRATWYGMTAIAALVRARGGAGAQAAADQIEALRDRLLPQGLSATQLTYLGEAGAALAVTAHLDDATREQLESMSLGAGTSVADAVALWRRYGARLGVLERAKSETAAKGAGVSGVSAARNQWIGVVSTILTVLEASKAPADDIEAVRRHILEASDRAAVRNATSAERKTEPPSGPAPAPAPAPGPQPGPTG